MSLTALDPRTALIVVDRQQGIVGFPFIHPIADAIAQTGFPIDAFRRHHLPVVLVNVAGRAPGRTEQGPRTSQTFAEGWTDLLPELDRQPSDIVVTRRSWGAFATTDLEDQLKARGVTQCLARRGFDAAGGRHNAMTDIREEAHQYCVRNVFPRVDETGTTKEVISLLEGLVERRSSAS